MATPTALIAAEQTHTPGVKVLFSKGGPRTAEERTALDALEPLRGGLRLAYVALVTLAVLGVVFALDLLAGAIREAAR